ncbi:conserved membrane hypothetical protein [Burkholderiales bacterium 8X]|nr:conserved membrane hypothetical protein [Burkholderiales bacterium 8X]
MAPEPQQALAWGDALGRHGLPVFAGALLVLAVLCGLAFRSTRGRLHVDANPDAPPAAARLIAVFGIGFAALLAVGALAFAAIARRISDQSWLVRFDHALSDAIGVQTPALALQFFSVATHLGDPLVLAVLCIAGAAWLWRVGRRTMALAWVLAIGGNAILNKSLKHVFERARPPYESLPWHAEGYSFPSGHTSGSVVAYGMVAYLALRLLPPRWQVPVATAAVLAIFTTACSRVFLQVHFASDVLAGATSGGLWLAICIAGAEASRHYRRHRRRRREAQLGES